MQSRLKAGGWVAILLGRWASRMSQEASLSCKIQEQQWQASMGASSSPLLVESRLNLPQKDISWRNGEMTSESKTGTRLLENGPILQQGLPVSKVWMPEHKKQLLLEQFAF